MSPGGALAQERPFITEFMAANSRTLNDEDGDSSDWIEIYNPSAAASSVAGWFLTDSSNQLTKWALPEVVLAPGEYLVVFASEKNRTNYPGRLHTNFRLSSEGEYLALVDARTNIVSEFAPAYPPQQTDVSFGRARLDAGAVGYFVAATPGAANSSSGAGFASAVRFSHGSGTFLAPFPLELSLDPGDSNATIRYTLDGSIPTNRSPVASGPLLITNSVQVRVRAFADGLLPGPVRSELYFAVAAGLAEVTSELPLILLHTMGGGAPASAGDRFVAVAVFEPRFGRASFLESPDLVCRARFNTRGNTTANYPKQSWNFEAWDEFDSDRDIPLLGMPADSDWVFYGPNNLEPVLIHNPFIHELSRRIGRYSPRTRFAEIYLNVTGGAVQANNYNGLYVIEEKIKIAPERVAIAKLKVEHVQPPSITGGYLLKSDFIDPGEVGVDVAGRRVLFVEPREQEIHLPAWRPQKGYLSNYFHLFYTALTGPDFRHPQLGYGPYIEAGSWIDHHLLQVLSLNVDALGLSEFYYKPREGPIVSGPLWDFDRAFFSTDGRETNPGIGRPVFSTSVNFWAASWWNRLFEDPDFFQKWIDRYQELRRGALATGQMHELIDGLVAQLIEAQPREQARWGASAPPRGGYSNEVNLMKTFLADRAYFIDTNFLAPPRLSSAGGRIDPGFMLSMVAPAGASAYYTLDGSDPRAAGGQPSTQALVYSRPVILNANARVVARSYHPGHRNLTGTQNPPLTSPWSGPSAATFVVAPLPLVVTEIMYHPAPGPPGDPTDQEQYEYLELKNTGDSPVSLAGVRFIRGIDFNFTGSAVTQLEADASVLIVRNRAAFLARYGERTNIAGEYTGQLDNAGERLNLEGPFHETILDFAYADNWYRVTDGLGFSLVIFNELGPVEDWGKSSGWRPSSVLGGSPGLANPPPSGIPNVTLNEILVEPVGAEPAAIELWNPTDVPADISHWWLSDDDKNPAKLRFAAGTVLAPGSFAVVERDVFETLPGPAPFAWERHGGVVWLFSATAEGTLTGYAHRLEYGPAEAGVSSSRYVDSTGGEQFASSTSTLGAANAGPRVGPVVISEVMYHPPDSVAGAITVDNSLDEYIELRNVSGEPVIFFDAAYPTNTWRLRGGVEFVFPSPSTLAPGQYALVVGFRVTDQARLDAFRARYAIAEDVPIFGPYSGKLDNSTDRVDLSRPGAPVVAPAPGAGALDYILVDRVRYADSSPWPASPDGTGLALQRLRETEFGNDPANWQVARPSPGRHLAEGAPPMIVSPPAAVHVVAGQSAGFQITAAGPPPLGYQWTRDGASIPGATNSTLALAGVRPEQAGDYAVVVYNSAGAVVSAGARLAVGLPPLISHGPASRSVQPGTHVTNSVVAAGVGVLRYEWRFNGVPLAGATNATLVLTNVQLDRAGTYEVTITDDVGSITTRPATILVLVRPTFTQQPQPAFQTLLEGDVVTFSVEVAPVHPSLPLGYRWRRNATPIPGQTNASLSFVLTNVISPTNALGTSNVFSVVVTNPASPGVFSSNAVVWVLADTDRDRMPDVWENGFGFNRNNPADAGSDADADGLSNLQEFIAGTNPTNRLSRLVLGQRREADGVHTLLLDAISNKTYTMQWREALGRGRWQTLTNLGLRPSNWLAAVADPYPAGSGRFYRVLTPQTGRSPAPGPILVMTPADTVVNAGEAVAWQVLAVGSGPLHYQWLFNGVPLANATDSSLAWSAVTPAQQGVYAVVVTDAAGSATSDPVRLTVRPE